MQSADGFIEAAVAEAGSDDFGGISFREGLARLLDALSSEAALTPMGEQMMGGRVHSLLVNRLRIEQTYAASPAIELERVDAPLFIIGLPRTGTTALSNLLSLDPQIRSLRVWESSSPVPPPEASTQDTDPRIAATERGLEMMDQAFPLMKSLHFQTATGPTECQDLLGMEFRTSHFDGMAYVPSYTRWVLDCDMVPAYRQHRRTLKLLQWRCPPTLWHLKTPVHMLALDALVTAYPDARFLFTHRPPGEVLGSVCNLIAYCRSWVSEEAAGRIGPEQLDIWDLALRRALAFRDGLATPAGRFADVRFDALNADPIGTIARAYDDLGLVFSDEAASRMRGWAGSHGRVGHEYPLSDFGLTSAEVDERFAPYLSRFDL